MKDNIFHKVRFSGKSEEKKKKKKKMDNFKSDIQLQKTKY